MNIPTPTVTWEEGPFGQMQPIWTSEPSVDAIKSVVRQNLDLDQTIEVDFLAQGGFNKLYSVKIGDTGHVYVMRVSLPVDPHLKVESEAATIELVRQRTNINVPGVIAFDSSNQNPLGYEWILMKFMKGQVLETAWKAMTWGNKEELVRTVARSLAQLFEQSFKGIGNIYFAKGGTGPSSLDATIGGEPNVQSHSSGYDFGEMVSMALFWNNRQKHKLYRGPYKGSADWLGALLELQIHESRDKICQLTTEKSNMEQSSLMMGSTSDQDQAEGLTSSPDGLPPLSTKPESISGHDDEEIEDAKSVVRLAEKLIESIPLFFSNASTEEAEVTYLYHDDVNWHNILADPGEQGVLTAILDWECVSTVPLWKACQYPRFLQGQPRDEEPRHDEYFWPEAEQVASGEEVEQVLYGAHMLEYEQTKLRRIFEEEMTKVVPEWSEVRQKSIRQADFALAVNWCDGPFTHRRVKVWLERTLAGKKEYQRLEEVNLFEES